jgi:hypothetical protein
MRARSPILCAEADGETGDARAGENRHDVDRQLAQQHQYCHEHHGGGHQAGQNAAQRGRPPLPFEVGGSVAARQLELQMPDRKIGGARDDECPGQDQQHVDPVGRRPAAQRARIPARVADAEPRQRERDARERGDAIGEHRQSADQLFGARLHCRAIVLVGDVERRQQPVHQRLRDADDNRGNREREQHRSDGRVTDRRHHSRWILR